MPECPVCKKDFFDKRHPHKKCCSVECKYEARREYVDCICKYCKKAFKKPKKAHVYCSIECESKCKKSITKDDLVLAMLQNRFGAWPNWSAIGRKFNRDSHVIIKLAKYLELIDNKRNGPIINGEYLPIPKKIVKLPIDPYLLYKEYLESKLLEKRIIDANTNCWIWDGHIHKSGYGYIYLNRPIDRECLVKFIAFYVWKNKPLLFKGFIFHKWNPCSYYS